MVILAQKKIRKYLSQETDIEKEYEIIEEKKDSKTDMAFGEESKSHTSSLFQGQIQITAKDIILHPFNLNSELFEEHNSIFQSSDIPENKKVKLYSFLATPLFIKNLTNLSLTLSHLKISKEEKMNILRAEITKINQNLPSNVYVPFVNSKSSVL